MSSALYESTSSQSSSNSNFFQNITAGWNTPDLTGWVIGTHYFVLAVCLVVGGLLLIDFFVRYFKMTPEDDFLANHLEAKKHFFQAVNTWTTYIPLLVLFYLYVFFKDTSPWNLIIAVLFFIAAGVKIFWEYSKTPISKVISGEDESLIGRFFKSVQDLKGKKKSTSSSTSVSFTGGIIGEVASQVAGLGNEALKQTTGVSVEQSGSSDKKK